MSEELVPGDPEAFILIRLYTGECDILHQIHFLSGTHKAFLRSMFESKASVISAPFRIIGSGDCPA